MITLIIHLYPKLKCRAENMLMGFIDFNLEMGAGNQKAGANLTGTELLGEYWARISGKIHSCDLSWKNVKHNEVKAIKAFWEKCECFIMLLRWRLWVMSSKFCLSNFISFLLFFSLELAAYRFTLSFLKTCKMRLRTELQTLKQSYYPCTVV